jgi:hypothetical protein
MPTQISFTSGVVQLMRSSLLDGLRGGAQIGAYGDA